ncbi:MAG TPA: ATP-binding protein [Vicinamibacterales bacterium]|nr:ATP-binding protein [Vicinamibacterales bacterium]
MNLRSRLSTIIAARVVLVTLLMGTAILIQINRPGSFPVDPFFALIGLTYALSVFYLAMLRFVERHLWLIDLQFGVDALLVSAFIHVTGGIASNFSSLYLLPIIAASMIRYRRVAIHVASLSAALYLALVTVQYVDVLPLARRFSPAVDLPTLRVAQYTVAINLGGFLAVAMLAGSLADSLRSAGAKLEHASLAIRDLRAFNEYVINSLLSGLITTDGEGRILTLNRAAVSILGIPAARAAGRDVCEVMQTPDWVRPRLPGLSEGRSLRVDCPHRPPDGRVLEMGLTFSSLTFPDGRKGYLLSFQDVTDVRRLEHEARLRQRLAAVGEMAAGIAHEIRNPLASMSGSIQVLRQELPLSEDQAQLMDIVLRESERLNDTIRSFLAYARPQPSAPARLDVRRILQDTALLLRNSAEVRGDHVIDVEAPREPVWCEADESQIRQVVWNLATNGLRAMASGGRLLLAVVADRTAGVDESVVLTVEDQGCGIAPEDLDSIFQPFRSSFERGTGLGLAIVHRVVTDYNGTIQVSSKVGVGTKVSVRLPAHAGTGGSVPAGDATRRSAVA